MSGERSMAATIHGASGYQQPASALSLFKIVKRIRLQHRLAINDKHIRVLPEVSPEHWNCAT